MKVCLVGYPGSQYIVPASKYLTSKYLPKSWEITYLNYTGEITGWAAFVRAHLNSILDERVIFALDDYLIDEPINLRQFETAEVKMATDPFCICVKLCYSTAKEHEEYPVTTQYCLWDREYLIRLLGAVHTPWEFELEGSRIHKLTAGKSNSWYVEHIPCLVYNTSSALSARWEGINWDGVSDADRDAIKQLTKTADIIDVYKATGMLLMDSADKIKDKVVVFGGAGFLGTHLIERIGSHNNILAVSRNEGELVKLKEKFPRVQIMVGDIADPWTVKQAMTGARFVYLLSAMKHVGLAESSVNSAVSTNVIGTMNVIHESTITKPTALVFISSDKAAQGSGVYGATKKIGERLMAEAERCNSDTKYRVIRYGNVWGSTGSIVTKWRPKMQAGEEVILTDPQASRFFWTVDEAVDLIFECLDKAKDATPYVPKMKAVNMGTVLEACLQVYCLPGRESPVKIIGLQPGENKVETMDGKIFSDQVEQFSKEEFIGKFLKAERDFAYDLGMFMAPPKEIKREHIKLQFRAATQEQSLEQAKEFAQKNPLPADFPFKNVLIGSSVAGLVHPKISCVLITRGEVFPEIIMERLVTSHFFDEIKVVPNCDSILNRYLAAAHAKNDILYVQDDDAMVNYQELFKHYNGKITNAMPLDFQKKYEGTGTTLVGWGCFFPKAMADSLEKYIYKYGVDDHLHREADRIFTALNAPFNTVIMPHEDLFQDGNRMGDEAHHYKSAEEAIAKVAAIQ